MKTIKLLGWPYVDRSLAGSTGTRQILIHLWPFPFERSKSSERLPSKETAGVFSFDQLLQPIDCNADQCILTAEESHCQNTITHEGEFLHPH